jgi:hypothetical protein
MAIDFPLELLQQMLTLLPDGRSYSEIQLGINTSSAEVIAKIQQLDHQAAQPTADQFAAIRYSARRGRMEQELRWLQESGL